MTLLINKILFKLADVDSLLLFFFLEFLKLNECEFKLRFELKTKCFKTGSGVPMHLVSKSDFHFLHFLFMEVLHSFHRELQISDSELILHWSLGILQCSYGQIFLLFKLGCEIYRNLNLRVQLTLFFQLISLLFNLVYKLFSFSTLFMMLMCRSTLLFLPFDVIIDFRIVT